MKTLYSAWLLYLIRETAAVTWVVGADGYVVDLPEWSALTGQSEEEIAGDGWMSAIHAEDVERVRAVWAAAVAHGLHYNTDYRLRCADGMYRWFNSRAVSIVDVEGKVQQWIGVLLPISGSSGGRRPALAAVIDKTTYVDITPGAVRAARAMLGWSASMLAERSGVSLSTVRRVEDSGERDSSRAASVRKMIDVLAHEALGFHTRSDGVIDGVYEVSAAPETATTLTPANDQFPAEITPREAPALSVNKASLDGIAPTSARR
ncbi:PAS domain S-box-containing protein [Duganella sp. CF517]|uniref:PAS domain-containing protein n=1 Tax=Duganella sp. CF517 TaxID=1881038 RepID=UPI0008C4A980|nr:PAS domain-containing protein [Duganella sp. CF517]SEO04368.1 PAS domain S-box-containing protein [Duganella sp. CF517]